MKEIEFYKALSGHSPVEEFIDSLNFKEAKKVAWTLRLVRDLDRVPEEYLKKLKALMIFGKLELNMEAIPLGSWDFMNRTK